MAQGALNEGHLWVCKTIVTTTLGWMNGDMRTLPASNFIPNDQIWLLVYQFNTTCTADDTHNIPSPSSVFR